MPAFDAIVVNLKEWLSKETIGKMEVFSAANKTAWWTQITKLIDENELNSILKS